MTRRESIRNIAIASSGAILLAGCTEANAIEFLKEGKLLLNKRHLQYVGKIAESLVPVSHLGDGVGNPTSFIMTMVNDCQSADDISKFTLGFDQFKLLLKENQTKLKSGTTDQILDQIKRQLDSEEPPSEMVFFIETIKNLAIRHLKTSKLYQQDVMEYRLIPTTYESCSALS